MAAFRGFFTAPFWNHVLVLVAGMVLTPASALPPFLAVVAALRRRYSLDISHY